LSGALYFPRTNGNLVSVGVATVGGVVGVGVVDVANVAVVDETMLSIVSLFHFF